MNPWPPYEPTVADPWDLAKVAHLHRRAGFAADWATLQRDLKDGPDAAIDRLLRPRQDEALASLVDGMEAQLGSSGTLARAQGIWLYRMILTPDPLRERLTLFWHDHFATSNAKVKNLGLLQQQIALLRRHALGDFGAMLRAVARDPAMLTWLDATANRKAHPNENYAREVMELFALGRGQYTENDIREAARAFTGSFIRGDRYVEEPSQHDGGAKTILGRTGPFRGDDVAAILLDQPACAAFLCRKLYGLFVSETAEPPAAIFAPLAAEFRDSGYEIARPVGTILRSRRFFDAAARRKRIKNPVEFAVGMLRALEVTKPTVRTDALAEAVGRMGQGLYAPPSVAGWDGGTAWINTTTLLARANLALGLLGDDPALGGRLDVAALAGRHGFAGGGEVASFLKDLLLPDGLDGKVFERVATVAADPGKGPKVAAREAAGLLLTAPEFQLA